jgi:hypothetical protein
VVNRAIFARFFGVVFAPQFAIHTRILAIKGFIGQP